MTPRRRGGVDVALSRKVAEDTRPRPKDKNCFHNAFCAYVPLIKATGFPPDRVLYVEGMATCSSGMLTGHGWLELPDGRIIEVTPAWLDDAALHPGARHYQARQRFKMLEVRAHLDRRGAKLPVLSELLGAFEKAKRRGT